MDKVLQFYLVFLFNLTIISCGIHSLRITCVFMPKNFPVKNDFWFERIKFEGA